MRENGSILEGLHIQRNKVQEPVIVEGASVLSDDSIRQKFMEDLKSCKSDTAFWKLVKKYKITNYKDNTSDLGTLSVDFPNSDGTKYRVYCKKRGRVKEYIFQSWTQKVNWKEEEKDFERRKPPMFSARDSYF